MQASPFASAQVAAVPCLSPGRTQLQQAVPVFTLPLFPAIPAASSSRSKADSPFQEWKSKPDSEREALAAWLQDLHTEQLKAVEEAMDSRAHKTLEAMREVNSLFEERWQQLEGTSKENHIALEKLNFAQEQTSAELTMAREDIESVRSEYRSTMNRMPLPEEPSTQLWDVSTELEQLRSRFDEYLATDLSRSNQQINHQHDLSSVFEVMQEAAKALEGSFSKMRDDLIIEQGRLGQMSDRVDILYKERAVHALYAAPGAAPPVGHPHLQAGQVTQSRSSGQEPCQGLSSHLSPLEARLHRQLETFADEFRGCVLELRTEVSRQSSEIADFQMALEAETSGRVACQEALAQAMRTGMTTDSPDHSRDVLEKDVLQLRGILEAERLARADCHEELSQAIRAEQKAREDISQNLRNQLSGEQASGAFAQEFAQLRALVETGQNMWSDLVHSIADERRGRETLGQDLKGLRLDLETIEARQVPVNGAHASGSTLSSTRESCDSEPVAWVQKLRDGSAKAYPGSGDADSEPTNAPRSPVPRLEFHGVSHT